MSNLKPRRPSGRGTCGYCQTNHHQFCPGSIRNAVQPRTDGDRTWYCPCLDVAHGEAEVLARKEREEKLAALASPPDSRGDEDEPSSG